MFDGPAIHRVCGRECADGSPCQNLVQTPGDACHLDGHSPEDPRVDDGPTDPSEVPLSGSFSGLANAGLALGKVLGVGFVLFLGTGPFLSDLLIRAVGIVSVLALALALNAYQHRALSEDETTAE